MGAPRVTETAIHRAIKAAQETGIRIGAVIVNNVEGTVRIEVQSTEHVDVKTNNVQRFPKKWGKG
jgi:predicted transcriptional regulator